MRWYSIPTTDQQDFSALWLCDESLKVPVIDLELVECFVWMVVQLCSPVNTDLT